MSIEKQKQKLIDYGASTELINSLLVYDFTFLKFFFEKTETAEFEITKEINGLLKRKFKWYQLLNIGCCKDGDDRLKRLFHLQLCKPNHENDDLEIKFQDICVYLVCENDLSKLKEFQQRFEILTKEGDKTESSVMGYKLTEKARYLLAYGLDVLSVLDILNRVGGVKKFNFLYDYLKKVNGFYSLTELDNIVDNLRRMTMSKTKDCLKDFPRPNYRLVYSDGQAAFNSTYKRKCLQSYNIPASDSNAKTLDLPTIIYNDDTGWQLSIPPNTSKENNLHVQGFKLSDLYKILNFNAKSFQLLCNHLNVLQVQGLQYETTLCEWIVHNLLRMHSGVEDFLTNLLWKETYDQLNEFLGDPSLLNTILNRLVPTVKCATPLAQQDEIQQGTNLEQSSLLIEEQSTSNKDIFSKHNKLNRKRKETLSESQSYFHFSYNQEGRTIQEIIEDLLNENFNWEPLKKIRNHKKGHEILTRLLMLKCTYKTEIKYASLESNFNQTCMDIVLDLKKLNVFEEPMFADDGSVIGYKLTAESNNLMAHGFNVEGIWRILTARAGLKKFKSINAYLKDHWYDEAMCESIIVKLPMKYLSENEVTRFLLDHQQEYFLKEKIKNFLIYQAYLQMQAPYNVLEAKNVLIQGFEATDLLKILNSNFKNLQLLYNHMSVVKVQGLEYERNISKWIVYKILRMDRGVEDFLTNLLQGERLNELNDFQASPLFVNTQNTVAQLVSCLIPRSLKSIQQVDNFDPKSPKINYILSEERRGKISKPKLNYLLNLCNPNGEAREEVKNLLDEKFTWDQLIEVGLRRDGEIRITILLSLQRYKPTAADKNTNLEAKLEKFRNISSSQACLNLKKLEAFEKIFSMRTAEGCYMKYIILSEESKCMLQHGFSVTQIWQILASSGGVKKFQSLWLHLKDKVFQNALLGIPDIRRWIVYTLSQKKFFKDKIDEYVDQLMLELHEGVMGSVLAQDGCQQSAIPFFKRVVTAEDIFSEEPTPSAENETSTTFHRL